MKKITKEELIDLSKNSRKSKLAKKYLAWSKLDREDQAKLSRLGSIGVEQKHDKEFLSDENYWSLKYPIVLEYYPYYGCDVYTDGEDHFLVYQEFGGHVPEKRCRFVQKELIM